MADTNQVKLAPTQSAWLTDLPQIALILLGLCITAFVAALVIYAINFTGSISQSQEHWGQFGDYIGGLLNPLVAMSALVGIWYSVALQKRELRDTRIALSEQAKTSEISRKEERFFDMLRLYQETLKSVEFQTRLDNVPINCFGKLALQTLTTQQDYIGGVGYNNLPGVLSKKEKLNKKDAGDAMDKLSGLLDHYFRVIHLLLKQAELVLGEQHYHYVKYFRAQFSKHELSLLALNVLFDDEGAKMMPKILQYGLFKHLPNGELRLMCERDLEPLCFGRSYCKNFEESENLGG